LVVGERQASAVIPERLTTNDRRLFR